MLQLLTCAWMQLAPRCERPTQLVATPPSRGLTATMPPLGLGPEQERYSFLRQPTRTRFLETGPPDCICARASQVERARLLREARQSSEPNPEEYASSRLVGSFSDTCCNWWRGPHDFAWRFSSFSSFFSSPQSAEPPPADVSFYEDALDLYASRCRTGASAQPAPPPLEARVEDLERQIALIRSQLQADRQQLQQLTSHLVARAKRPAASRPRSRKHHCPLT